MPSSVNMWCYVQMKSKRVVYRVYLATRTQDFSLWSSVSCKDYRIEVQVTFCFPQVETFCSLCYWLSSSVPVAVAHYLFIGCLVWKSIQSFNMDNKSEQWVCPSRYTGYHLCLLGSWLVFFLLYLTVLKVWEIWLWVVIFQFLLTLAKSFVLHLYTQDSF